MQVPSWLLKIKISTVAQETKTFYRKTYLILEICLQYFAHG